MHHLLTFVKNSPLAKTL